MPTSLAERRHSLSLVGLAALQGITQPASAHETEQLDLVTTTPPKDNHVSCFTAWRGVSGVHNRPFNLAASCVEALLPGGDFFSLSFRKECFCSFQTLLVPLLTSTEVACFLTEKNYDVASFAQEFCTGNIIPSPLRLEHGDDGWSFPFRRRLMMRRQRGVAC
jgi:hypothetical protein